jgi:hypothetical protein
MREHINKPARAQSARAKELAEAERSHWLYRAVERTHGNQTLLGCLVLAVMNKNAKNPPWLAPKGMVIWPDGACVTMIIRQRGDAELPLQLGHISQVVDNWRQLADEINATDAERVQMFDELRKHVLKDMRDQRAAGGSQII